MASVLPSPIFSSFQRARETGFGARHAHRVHLPRRRDQGLAGLRLPRSGGARQRAPQDVCAGDATHGRIRRRPFFRRKRYAHFCGLLVSNVARSGCKPRTLTRTKPISYLSSMTTNHQVAESTAATPLLSVGRNLERPSHTSSLSELESAVGAKCEVTGGWAASCARPVLYCTG